jgi:hypothetical protein
MPKAKAYQAVQHDITDAILTCHDDLEFSSLDEEECPERMMQIARIQLQHTKKLSRSLDISSRYYQGKALHRRRQENPKALGTLGLDKYETEMVDKVYQLFKGHEWIVRTFYGSARDISRLTYAEIGRLWSIIQKPDEPLNAVLSELLDFTGPEFRFEDEPNRSRDVDDTPSSQVPPFSSDTV